MRTIQDLLAERRAMLRERDAATDATGRAVLQAQIDVLDLDINEYPCDERKEREAARGDYLRAAQKDGW